ncbi:MAG: mannose-1-phosphate guanylyltransferase/mannose-6-phosphate isomerase [Desulfobulbaceae bacterium A2]|nr:MAG: mannose-1-phosphate guanylyltransferase/mannose-6-phosphate isomerase [Desulfobulbaceae bacterium A2]
MSILPVILAGGSGTRLWPLSRELYPKQLLQLLGEESLLQATVRRLAALAELGEVLPPLLVVSEEQRFLTRDQLEALRLEAGYHLLLEPVARNTAPAVCGAALYARQLAGAGTVLLVLPADHLISRPRALAEAVGRAAILAAEGQLVTFGIVPDHPETGYGYIARGEGQRVAAFVEKPDAATAAAYVASGNYFWNSGMFAFTTSTLLEEMAEHAPEMLGCMEEAVRKGRTDGSCFRFDAEAMARCPDDSIDYALMEKTSRAAMVEADIGWNDIGSWRALWEVSSKDERGNSTRGDVLLHDVDNCFIRAESMLVATIGLKDTMVIETADAVLVAPLDRAQDVKQVVKRLKQQGRHELLSHRTVHRPWGSYTTLEMQPRFQIKRITVHPGARLSLQMHHHRHEHWVVVSGTARVTNGDQDILVYENQSTYIPAGTKHRLENPGVIPLELIEVQIGSYLGEDDIVRFDDVYGRKTEGKAAA